MKVVVATTVMLSFISFWRAAAIVLSDLASSAYYAGGIAETAIGKSAPWFILSIMLFSYAVRSIYIESCSMFVRGGVYKVVHEAMGGTLAKFSVSALMFDYILTGPISAVSAGLYLAGLINETEDHFHITGGHVSPRLFAAGFAILVTLYFWRKNIIGIRESSENALRIMQITTVMVVILIAWCLITIRIKGFQPVPWPVGRNLNFGANALGWLKETAAPQITFIAILVGLGHSLLAMSGEESLAQVNREIEAPKLKNLERAGFVIFLYSLLFTSLVSFFAVMLIPDGERARYLDNLIGGLSMFLAGPYGVRLLFHALVVLVGTLILAGAVNTAIIGSNGVLNRVAEDGVLPNFLRLPHPKFGTTNRILNLIVGLQLLTILISRGNVKMLGEAYAFGVVWSFAMKALAVIILRFKRPEARAWKVPFNLRIGTKEWPIGLALITLALFALATINVLTKKAATISGMAFTVAFFTIFELSERYNRQHRSAGSAGMEEFQLKQSEEVSAEALRARPGNILVPVHNPHRIRHLEKTLAGTDIGKEDVVVLSVHFASPAGSGEHDLREDQIFGLRETEVFSIVVSAAERAGKHVALLAVAGTNPLVAILQTAMKLKSARIVLNHSPQFRNAGDQARAAEKQWKRLPAPRFPIVLEIVPEDSPNSQFYIFGQHLTRLWPEDFERIHKLWLEISEKEPSTEIRHRDVVSVALSRFDKEFHSDQGDKILNEIRREVQEQKHGMKPGSEQSED
ncbi:MAG TPA: APC family permease [Acidobacteriota bacterium]|nr:APC family permease [Acidobacteriota bacterium]